jgi:hypothetical protein
VSWRAWGCEVAVGVRKVVFFRVHCKSNCSHIYGVKAVQNEMQERYPTRSGFKRFKGFTERALISL